MGCEGLHRAVPHCLSVDMLDHALVAPCLDRYVSTDRSDGKDRVIHRRMDRGAIGWYRIGTRLYIHQIYTTPCSQNGRRSKHRPSLDPRHGGVLAAMSASSSLAVLQ